MTRILYSALVNKTNPSNTLESVQPCSGLYSLKKDIKRNSWLAVAAVVYCINLFLARRHPEWSVTIRAASALAPLVPGLLYIWTGMRFLNGLDELQRRIQLEAGLFALLGTLLVGIAISTLGDSGVHLGDLEHGLGMGQAFIVAFVLWLVGFAIANCRFK
jgi:hypothetical protein